MNIYIVVVFGEIPLNITNCHLRPRKYLLRRVYDVSIFKHKINLLFLKYLFSWKYILFAVGFKMVKLKILEKFQILTIVSAVLS